MLPLLAGPAHSPVRTTNAIGSTTTGTSSGAIGRSTVTDEKLLNLGQHRRLAHGTRVLSPLQPIRDTVRVKVVEAREKHTISG